MAIPRQRTVPALEPYVPRLAVDWLRHHDGERHRRITGTLAFVDISGFTALTERLARKGHVGAEEMSDALDATFGHLLDVADRQGADLVKWGGDAILLMFSGDGHAERACVAAWNMRSRLREVGRLRTTAGRIDLKMSVGIHSGDFDYFLVGDPALHRELLVTGPAASETARLEGVAVAGQVVVSDTVAAHIGGRVLGERVDPGGRLLRRRPDAAGATPVPPTATTSTARVDVSRMLPVAIREHLLAGLGAPEHRTIAVAFVQFAGTDALLADEGPEATAEALDDCIRNVAHACAAHGVTFFETDINADGGKVMLTAGAPRTAGHDADRLLRTARQILDRSGRLPLRIGLNMGHVFSGGFGPPFRRTYSVKGDAINLAARVMGKAVPGELLATQAAYDHAETRFETVEAGPFTVKGKALPVHAVSVGAITGGPVRRSGGTALVGRDRELAALDDALESARTGAGRVVQLLGEPGIGKSRLIEELVASAGTDVDVRALVCDEYQSATPYAAFRDLLRDLLGITDDVPGETGPALVAGTVAAVAPALTPWVPLLGDVLDLPIPDTDATRELDDEFRRARLHDTVATLLQALLPGPTVLTVDDAHHMDPASADLMDKVAGAARHRPWLVVASRRDVPVGWLPAEDLRRVDLRVLPLTAEDSLRLAAAAADGHALPRPALAALARRADGNPLFLESLVGQAGPAGTLDGLPDSVEEVLAAQIDRLPPARRDVLRRAAVLGNQFSQAQLLALLPDPPSSVDDQLSDGLGEFLVPVDSGRELRFRHALVRDVAYQGLAFRARRRMHDQVGLALEGGQGPARPEVLSFHFLHAGRYLKAWSYARTAGEDAKRKYANTEATELLGRAVEAARHLPRDTVPARELGLVLESLGDCWFTIGLSDAALASYREAHRKVRGDIFDSARIVAKQAAVDGRLRRFPQAMGRISRQLRAFDGLDGVDVHRARSILLRRYAISRASQGRLDDARHWGADAVTEAKRSKDPEVLAPAYGTLHGVYLAAGLEDHHALGTLALRSYVEIDDLSGQAQCTNNLAVAALEDHRWPEAATMFGRAADLYRRRGDIDNEGVALCNHAEVLVNQGRCDVAAPLLDEALAIARSVADDELRALVLRQQGRARARTGEPAEGLALLQEARVLFATIGADDEAARTDLSLAEATLLSGDLTGALHRTEALLAGTELDDQRAEAHALRGFALLRLDRRDEAVREFRHGAPGHGRVRGYGEALSCLGLAEAGVERASAWTERGWRALRSLDVVAPPAPAERGPVESALVASE